MTAVTYPTLANRISITKNQTLTKVLVVFAFAFFTAGMAQISFKLPFTPVPLTGQTFAVVLSGAALGASLGAASQLLYLLMGLFLPFYSEGTHGWTVLHGATGGYIVGFIFAAALVGYLAEKGQDRSLLSSFAAMVAGNVIIYAFGLLWLAHSLNVGQAKAIEWGLTPFIVGDMFKILLASALLPTSWKLLGDKR